MNIVEKKKLVLDTIHTIKASIVMFGGNITGELRDLKNETYTLMFHFNEWTKIEINVDLYSNCISSMVYGRKYEAFYMKACFNAVNATPKVIYSQYGYNNVYHCFKISRANCERLYRMFCVMAKF